MRHLDLLGQIVQRGIHDVLDPRLPAGVDGLDGLLDLEREGFGQVGAEVVE
jgi:hypothetical protein